MAVPIRFRRPAVRRRRLILFVAAFLVPCAVVATLAYRTMALDRELAALRQQDDRQRIAATIRQELLARLERLKAAATAGRGVLLQQHGPPSAVILTGWVDGDRLVLPWERNAAVDDARAALAAMPFARHVADGERAELIFQRPRAAAAHYKRAAAVATQAAQTAGAELLLARASSKAGRLPDAEATDRRVLARPLSLVDDLGIPFALYAARRVAERQTSSKADLRAALDVAIAADNAASLTPTAWHMALSAAADAQARDPGLRARAAAFIDASASRTRLIDQALALQRAFPGMLARLPTSLDPSAESIWIPFGADPWFVSLASHDGRPLAVAVGAQAAFDTLETVRGCRTSGSCEARLLFGRGDAGDLLGPQFPGTMLDYRASGVPREAQRISLQRRFYLTVLLVVTALSLIGAFLLWRDVRRDVQVAEMRSQFVSSVSHELKTPLTAIRMFAEMLRMGRPADSATRNEYLDTIVSESERLTRLLNNVLDFSRIEQGRKHYHIAPHDPAAVVRAAARAMQYPLAQQGFTLHIELDPALPPVPMDADAMEQAILNLLANAMKYSGDRRLIDLRLGADGGFACIAVRDRGVGIPPQEQRRVFEKFYRVPTAENERIPGTGLGLTLVDHIARAHGGSVAVASAPGEGSTFVLRLPLARVAADVAGSDGAPSRTEELQV